MQDIARFTLLFQSTTGELTLQAERAFDALEESIRSQAVAIAKQYGMTFNIEAD